MANTNNISPRQTHVSPGIYTKETDLTYAAKSLGITTLGVVGETVKGPAFQPIMIQNWREYQNYFGGTNPEKYRGSQYPKYELPYIAQSYLKQSNQLQVVRVLGLSGVNAGPAWVITAKNVEGEDHEYDNIVIAVLRSRGEHKKATLVRTMDVDEGVCEDEYEYDGIEYYAKHVTLEPSASLTLGNGCDPNYSAERHGFDIKPTNYGRFTIKVQISDDEDGVENIEYKKYSVSLNPGEKNYIYNVLGGDPEVGETEIYVEELYDVALQQLVEDGKIDTISADIDEYLQVYVMPKHKSVDDLLDLPEKMLTRKHVGKRYLYDGERTSTMDENGNKIMVNYTVHEYDESTHTYAETTAEIGRIYTVVAHTGVDGKRHYYYVLKDEDADTLKPNTPNLDYYDESGRIISDPAKVQQRIFKDCVYVKARSAYYTQIIGNVQPISFDFNNYKEQYRYASTPWIVSELKGSAENVELNKLFRFHTISDGSNSNTEVKVSIENIEPSYGTFDVIVRDFNDTDAAKMVVERFRGVTLIPGDQNYIAKRIGSFDGQYVNVSNYITVEVNENDKTMLSSPAGFLGYPVRDYGSNIFKINNSSPVVEPIKPYLKYNSNVDEEIRVNKQYFGLSDLVGIDTDVLKYKGVDAYNEVPSGLTPCFHLDARIFGGKPNEYGEVETGVYVDGVEMKQTVTVDGVTGYEWVTVGKDNVTDFGFEPRIGNDEIMANTIYEDKRYRKFTVCFYGGFDGWDYYRTSRSNSDEFRYNHYRGKIDRNTGIGKIFSTLDDVENYGFDADTKALNTDYYAYLSGIRQLANPKTIEINVLATPGIDYVNNKALVSETIDIVEEERTDSIYVVTTPDKPFGAGDTMAEMFTPSDAVVNLEDADIDSNYTCTYYPWVKYYDNDNSVYVYLPPTRDVVKNFAYTDNTRYPWFAAAGWNRGDLENNAVRPKRILRLAEQDELYNGRINFINNFANEGMKIWGDKNLQERESQMNRISKRRLLLHIRKLCAIAAIGLIFDPNDNTTKQAFESAVSPILDNVMSNRGITDWRLEIDDSQEARDRLELPAKIFLKPTPNLEYITIDFIITPSGVSFDDI